MGCRPFRLDVGPRPADYDRQFQFEVHELAVPGPEDFRIRTDDRQGIAFMVDRLLKIERRQFGEWRGGGGRHSGQPGAQALHAGIRSEEHTSELQSLMRISYAVFCLKKKKKNKHLNTRRKYI